MSDPDIQNDDEALAEAVSDFVDKFTDQFKVALIDYISDIRRAAFREGQADEAQRRDLEQWDKLYKQASHAKDEE